MKTNNKLHPVFAYILDCIPGDLMESYGLDKEPETPAEKLQFVYDTFLSEKGYEIKRIGEYKAFQD